MKTWMTLTAACTATLFAGSAVRASVLLGWELSDNSGDSSAVAETFDTGISQTSPSGTVSIEGELIPSDYLDQSLLARNAKGTTLAEAITNEDYYAFSIKPKANTAMDLSSIEISPQAQDVSRTFALFSSVEGFSSADEIDSFDYKGNFGGSRQTVALPASDFTGLTGAVDFRLYIFGDYDNTYQAVGIGNTSGDDLIVNGTTAAVPEPASLALLGLGGLAMLGGRRRTR